MPIFKADYCRLLAAECRQSALLSVNVVEKAHLTNLALSWTKIATQTDRYVGFLETLSSKSKSASVDGLFHGKKNPPA
jgi:hypothetical protein